MSLQAQTGGETQRSLWLRRVDKIPHPYSHRRVTPRSFSGIHLLFHSSSILYVYSSLLWSISQMWPLKGSKCFLGAIVLATIPVSLQRQTIHHCPPPSPASDPPPGPYCPAPLIAFVISSCCRDVYPPCEMLTIIGVAFQSHSVSWNVSRAHLLTASLWRLALKKPAFP